MELKSDIKQVSGHYVLDHRKERSTDYYLVKCVKCGYESWRSNGFLKAKAICPQCSKGRHMHNAQGFGNDPLFKRYQIIQRRIRSPYKYIGITMCDEWENDFQAFRKWSLENGYREGLTIDRIDNANGYSPDNCRWVTPKQQANNRSTNVFLEYDGKNFTLSELADYTGFNASTIKQRYESGWDVVDIVKTPYKARKKWSEVNAE